MGGISSICEVGLCCGEEEVKNEDNDEEKLSELGGRVDGWMTVEGCCWTCTARTC